MLIWAYRTVKGLTNTDYIADYAIKYEAEKTMKVVPEDTDTPEDVRLCKFILEIVQTAMLTIQSSLKPNAIILVFDWHCGYQHWHLHLRYSRMRCLLHNSRAISGVQRVPSFVEQNTEEFVVIASYRVLSFVLHLRQELNSFMIHITNCLPLNQLLIS